MLLNFSMCAAVSISSAIRNGLCFGQRFEILIKASHAGDAGSAVADVVDDFVRSAEDFAGFTEHVGVPGIRLDYPEHAGHLLRKSPSGFCQPCRYAAR